MKEQRTNVKYKIKGHLDCRRRGEGAAGPGLYIIIKTPLLLLKKYPNPIKLGIISRITVSFVSFHSYFKSLRTFFHLI